MHRLGGSKSQFLRRFLLYRLGGSKSLFICRFFSTDLVGPSHSSHARLCYASKSWFTCRLPLRILGDQAMVHLQESVVQTWWVQVVVPVQVSLKQTWWVQVMVHMQAYVMQNWRAQVTVHMHSFVMRPSRGSHAGLCCAHLVDQSMVHMQAYVTHTWLIKPWFICRLLLYRLGGSKP